MLASVSRYLDDAAALEKTLRLLQSTCTIAIGLLAGTPDAAPWLKARTQFALGRRYFRVLKWYPCFRAAHGAFKGAQNDRPFETMLAVTEKSFLGMYFFLEMFTITNAIGITDYEWGPAMQREADKSWLYAIIASIMLGLCQLLFSPTPTPTEKVTEKAAKDDKKKGKGKTATDEKAVEAKQPAPANSGAYTRLVIDCCDAFIPGASLGWIAAGPVVVGSAQFISTVLAGEQIWQRVQSTNRTA